MPKRASSSRGPSASRSTIRSGSSGQASAKRAIGGVGRGLGVGVGREALAEEREHVPPLGRERGVDRRLAGGLDPGRRGRAAGAGVLRGALEVVERVADVDRTRARRSSPGQAGKSGRPSSSSITFTTGPACLQPAGGSTPASAGRAQRVGVRDHRAGAHLVAALEHDPGRRGRRSTQHPLDRRLHPHARARRLGRGAQRPRDRAHAAAREAPGARRPGRLAEVVVEADERGARVARARRACRSGPGGRTARGPAPRGCRPARRRPAPSSSSLADRLEPALAVGRLEHQRPGARGRGARRPRAHAR